MLIRYALPGSLPTYSFRDVATGKVKPATFSGKVVLIGATALGDAATSLAVTPVGRLPRVEVTADALSTILDRSYVEVVSDSRYHLLGVMIMVGLVTGLLLMLVSGVRSALVTIALLLGYLITCWLFFTSGHRPRDDCAPAGLPHHLLAVFHLRAFAAADLACRADDSDDIPGQPPALSRPAAPPDAGIIVNLCAAPTGHGALVTFQPLLLPLHRRRPLCYTETEGESNERGVSPSHFHTCESEPAVGDRPL